MPGETHKLQNDPPEGSREVIEHELRRNPGREPDAGEGAKGSSERAADRTAADKSKAGERS